MGLMIDFVIVALLLVAVGFGLVLERRVARLRAMLEELGPMVEQFALAVDRSEDTVQALRSVAETGPAPRKPARPAPQPGIAPAAKARRSHSATIRSANGSAAPTPDDKSELVKSFFASAKDRST